MLRHVVTLLVVVASVGCKRADTAAAPAVPDAGVVPAIRLGTVGPRLLSNATDNPLSITGVGLKKATALKLGPPINVTLPLTVVDDSHAFTRVPQGSKLGPGSEVVVEATLDVGEGRAELRFINDTTFPDLVGFALTNDGAFLVAVSSTEDAAYVVERATKKVTRLSVDDGPSAIAALGSRSVIISHSFSKSLVTIDLSTSPPTLVRATAPSMSANVVVDGTTVFVAEHATDTVSALDSSQGLRVVWSTAVAPNPKAMTVTRAGLAVGSLQTGEVELLDLKTGARVSTGEPGPGTPIVGGTTAKYSQYVMNGKAPRALVASQKLSRVFLASIGPNIGPNPDKMEVSMNGGVASVLLPGGRDRKDVAFERHLGFGAGVTDSLAIDDAQGLLYAADVALGVVRVIDAAKLAKSDADAAKALVQVVPLPPPSGFPHVRPDADFDVNGRAGVSLHSGPRALALSSDGKTLFVLNRFTGTIAVIDVSQAKKAKAEWKEQWPVVEVLAQKTRRLGQVLYYADLGRTAMSCDACHVDGHNEGILFEKTMPLRIYRSTTVRGSRETPPYFTPASTHSLGETSKMVGSRNRYQNPPVSPEEIEALTLYSSLIPTLPNPFVQASGAPAETLTLPDGATGSPLKGLALFEGKAACASCHPAPQFTLDQDHATRNRFIDVGTPHFMPLRPDFQNRRFEGFGTPALVGAWDIFPMLTTGLAGLSVTDGGSVVVTDRFALRVAIERWAPTHGRADLLTPEERNDLLAWVLSL